MKHLINRLKCILGFHDWRIIEWNAHWDKRRKECKRCDAYKYYYKLPSEKRWKYGGGKNYFGHGIY